MSAVGPPITSRALGFQRVATGSHRPDVRFASTGSRSVAACVNAAMRSGSIRPLLTSVRTDAASRRAVPEVPPPMAGAHAVRRLLQRLPQSRCIDRLRPGDNQYVNEVLGASTRLFLLALTACLGVDLPLRAARAARQEPRSGLFRQMPEGWMWLTCRVSM